MIVLNEEKIIGRASRDGKKIPKELARFCMLDPKLSLMKKCTTIVCPAAKLNQDVKQEEKQETCVLGHRTTITMRIT